jgi:peptidoglycan hydrolase-like protein with peptidoglycan-binding domain
MEERRRMAAAIVNFEARRDGQDHLAVYALPPGDGGGSYEVAGINERYNEVAGINERYNKDTADLLVALIEQRRYDEAEALAADFIAQDTDRAMSWTSVPAIEFYLRDSVFNRGAGGAARILQRALGIQDDGVVGGQTRSAETAAESDPLALLRRLRAAREQYERDAAHRDETSPFWAGLVNRWNKAIDVAKTFPLTRSPSVVAPPPSPTTPAPIPTSSPLPTAIEMSMPATLPGLGPDMRGERVAAWQAFLTGQGFDPGPIDGYFSEHTRDATKEFQHKYRLEEDGIAGRQTLLKAAARGLELIEEPAADETSSNFPPRPSFGPVVTNTQREALFGHYDYVPAPTPDNAEAIRILGTWQEDNIIGVPIERSR